MEPVLKSDDPEMLQSITRAGSMETCVTFTRLLTNTESENARFQRVREKLVTDL